MALHYTGHSFTLCTLLCLLGICSTFPCNPEQFYTVENKSLYTLQYVHLRKRAIGFLFFFNQVKVGKGSRNIERMINSFFHYLNKIMKKEIMK